MSDLISRQAAIDELKIAYWDNDIQSAKDDPCIVDAMTDWAIRQVKALPSADVAPVRHGHWEITDAYPHNVYCSECCKSFAQTHWAVWNDGSLPRNFCPNCGARMDGD